MAELKKGGGGVQYIASLSYGKEVLPCLRLSSNTICHLTALFHAEGGQPTQFPDDSSNDGV